ncbi:hypothetical protein [Micromonospora sp. B9E7]|uniref:hypothetical protein n=1 Tax=Micromonospora sp. B9E7 TaxID=3153574 RepID=UPI00325DC760
MRRSLGDGWSIDLHGDWTPERAEDGGTIWCAPGRTMLVVPGTSWRCADGADIIASLDAELPPNPTSKLGEGGRDGIGHRAAWVYHHERDVNSTLYGYSFVDRTYLETIFTNTHPADLGWAFDAWRSVTRSAA